ncbi:MAG TPA: DUF3341 domain-containing protein [Beijerinckiaceae bacterium]
MSGRMHGVMAEFATPDALIAAVSAAKGAGYTRLDAFSPFPLREVAEQLGVRPSIIPWIAWVTGCIGAAIQYGVQYWLNALDYPLNVGGRPLHSWPAFIPSTLIVAILWAGAATLLSMLLIIRLPRLHHPVFAIRGFERASEDRFFLLVLSDDPMFDLTRARSLLQGLAPVAVRDVPA